MLAAVSVMGPTPFVSTLRGLTYIGTVGDAAALFIAPRPFRRGALLPDRWLRMRRWSTGGKTALLLSEPALAHRSVTCRSIGTNKIKGLPEFRLLAAGRTGVRGLATIGLGRPVPAVAALRARVRGRVVRDAAVVFVAP